MAAAAHEPEPNPRRVHFVAPDKSYWSVHETRDPRSPSGTALLFVSEAGFRRVRRYPAEWRTLSDGELWALSWES